MAKDAANSIVYYLSVNQENKADLARIRQWGNLKVGFEENTIWIKDLDYVQVNSTEVKSIPFKAVYYEKQGKLYPLNSLLPQCLVPSLLWTPVERALPVKLPSFNHNYFGIHEQIDIRLVPHDAEAEAVAMITDTGVLKQYIETAPSVRLEKIRWCLQEGNKVLLLGRPLLPLPGDTFWQRKDLLLPTGFDFELHLLTDIIQKRVNPGRDHWVCWNTDGTCWLVAKENMMPLSRSSFRLSYQHPL
jgi:hypothetical protein